MTTHTIESLAARLAILEASQPPKPISPKLLEMMASNTVRRVPKNWTGRDVTGMRYDALTADECERLAGYHEYMAKKSMEDAEPRKKDNGEFWYKTDQKAAQALRAFAAKASTEPSDAPF